MLDWVQVAILLPTAVAIVLRGTERKVVARLQSAEATSETTAIKLPRISRLGRWQLSRLEHFGAVVPVSDDRYYFDPGGYRSFRGLRQKRAAIVVPVLIVTILILWYLSECECVAVYHLIPAVE